MYGPCVAKETEPLAINIEPGLEIGFRGPLIGGIESSILYLYTDNTITFSNLHLPFSLRIGKPLFNVRDNLV